ncbi:MAG: hypothetical protein ACPG4S_05925, partial [Schleiferiaceae bacterium]
LFELTLINGNGYFMTGSQEVVGSNPIFSTITKGERVAGAFFYAGNLRCLHQRIFGIKKGAATVRWRLLY